MEGGNVVLVSVRQAPLTDDWMVTIRMPFSGKATFWSSRRARAVRKALRAYKREERLMQKLGMEPEGYT